MAKSKQLLFDPSRLHLNKYAKYSAIALNILFIISWAYVNAITRNANCSNGSCSDFGLLILIRPDLLISFIIIATVPIIDALILFNLVGSRMGIGKPAARRIMYLFVGRSVLIWTTARLMHLTN